MSNAAIITPTNTAPELTQAKAVARAEAKRAAMIREMGKQSIQQHKSAYIALAQL